VCVFVCIHTREKLGNTYFEITSKPKERTILLTDMSIAVYILRE